MLLQDSPRIRSIGKNQEILHATTEASERVLGFRLIEKRFPLF